MLLDANLQLSGAQAVTTSAPSINTIDLTAVREMAMGGRLSVVFSVDVSVTAAGAATVAFQIVSSPNANLSSPTILAQTGAIPKADLIAGRRLFSIGLAQHALAAQALGQRYLGAQYAVGNGPLTAGAFSAWLSDSKGDTSVFYPQSASVY